MGHNYLSGSISLLTTGSIQITGSFYGYHRGVLTGSHQGDGAGLVNIPFTSVYSMTNPGTGRMVTTRDSSGNSFEGHSNFTYSEADKALTVKGIDSTTAVTVTGSSNNTLLRLKANSQPNLLYVAGSGKIGIGTALPTHMLSLSGTMAMSASTNPLYLQGVQTATIANTSSYLALDTSTGRVVLTSSAQGSGEGGGIGAAEDGSYADGLYTDFVTSTPVGTAVDRFNEVLKILSPSPAPAVRSIDEDVTDGVAAKLSFGVSAEAIPGFTGVGAGIAGAENRNSAYQTEIVSSNLRLGVYENNQTITGDVNNNVDRSETNGFLAFASGSFTNGDTGTLKLEINGSTVHSVNLASFSGAGNPATGSASSLTSNSGFINVSTAASSFDGNGAEWYIFKHRTAKYQIHPNDMRNGWNYARVIHTVGGTDNETNYIEWVNDPSGAVNNLAATGGRIEDITLAGSKYLSGVRYNTGATAKYKVDVANMYENVFPASGAPVTFAVANSSTPSAQSVPDLGAGQDHDTVLRLTASLSVNVDSLLNGAITANVTATHPLKSTLSAAGAASTGNGFLIDDRTLSSVNLSEKFHDESFRKLSGSFDTQANASGNATNWDSQNHMLATGSAGHTDGLIMYNQRLYSPKASSVAASGEFDSLSNTPAGQPDYSGITGLRTFYRKIQNTSGAAVRDMKITSYKGSARLISDASSLSGQTNKIKVYAKIPATTGWMDISQNFTYGSVIDAAGALVDGADDNNNVGTGTSDAVHCITFGSASVANNDYVMLKILADAAWVGHITQLDFQLGASDVSAPTEAPQLDDIETDASGVSDAKLSFGASNAVAGYTPVTGSALGLSDFDSNVNYTESGDRLGVFGTKANIVGDLNDDVSASGQNYPANSFKDAYTGTLELHVNGRKVHEIDLSSTVSAITDNFNGNNSGFSVSALAWSSTSDSIPDYTKPYRTGTLQIGANDQDLGFNSARVVHKRSGLSDVNTNYIEWVVDTDNNALASANLSLANFNHGDIYYQSGVRYFASQPSASYAYRAQNVYRNVYQNGTAVSFPNTTNCFVNNIKIAGAGVSTLDTDAASVSLPSLNNSSDCELKDIHVTGTVVLDNSTSISGGLGLYTDLDVTVTSQILHPQKTNLTTSAQSKTAFMYYSGTIGSTSLTTDEHFGLETYRLESGSYANQAAVLDAANTWNSQTSVNDVGSHATYADGLVTSNGYAISPMKIGNAGDTRNVADGGSLQAPAGSPNYSSPTNATRTYYRYFRNTTGVAKATFTITLYGDASLVAKSGAFYVGSPGANKNINVEVKVPYDPSYTGGDDTSTAWADCIKPYSAGTQPDADGVGVYNGGGGDLNQTVGGGGRAVAIQLQTKQIRNNQYFVVKVTAHKDWTGYLSRIGITY